MPEKPDNTEIYISSYQEVWLGVVYFASCASMVVKILQS